MAARRYVIPRALDAPDQLFPGFTLLQAASALAACAMAYWVWFHSGLPLQARVWLVVYLPVIGAAATRTVRRWPLLAWAQALWHRASRPGRTVYLPGED